MRPAFPKRPGFCLRTSDRDLLTTLPSAGRSHRNDELFGDTKRFGRALSARLCLVDSAVAAPTGVGSADPASGRFSHCSDGGRTVFAIICAVMDSLSAVLGNPG